MSLSAAFAVEPPEMLAARLHATRALGAAGAVGDDDYAALGGVVAGATFEDAARVSRASCRCSCARRSGLTPMTWECSARCRLRRRSPCRSRSSSALFVAAGGANVSQHRGLRPEWRMWHGGRRALCRWLDDSGDDMCGAALPSVAGAITIARSHAAALPVLQTSARAATPLGCLGSGCDAARSLASARRWVWRVVAPLACGGASTSRRTHYCEGAPHGAVRRCHAWEIGIRVRSTSAWRRVVPPSELAAPVCYVPSGGRVRRRRRQCRQMESRPCEDTRE